MQQLREGVDALPWGRARWPWRLLGLSGTEHRSGGRSLFSGAALLVPGSNTGMKASCCRLHFGVLEPGEPLRARELADPSTSRRSSRGQTPPPQPACGHLAPPHFPTSGWPRPLSYCPSWSPATESWRPGHSLVPERGGLIMQIRFIFNCQRQWQRLDGRTLC